jgi:hypothetical protein
MRDCGLIVEIAPSSLRQARHGSHDVTWRGVSEY